MSEHKERAQARAAAKAVEEALAAQLQALLFKPDDQDRLQREIEKAIRPFLADVPEPDYLSIEWEDRPEDRANLVLRGVIRIDPEKAPPHAMETWRRLRAIQTGRHQGGCGPIYEGGVRVEEGCACGCWGDDQCGLKECPHEVKKLSFFESGGLLDQEQQAAFVEAVKASCPFCGAQPGECPCLETGKGPQSSFCDYYGMKLSGKDAEAHLRSFIANSDVVLDVMGTPLTFDILHVAQEIAFENDNLIEAMVCCPEVWAASELCESEHLKAADHPLAIHVLPSSFGDLRILKPDILVPDHIVLLIENSRDAFVIKNVGHSG